jgi:hypothetical protein
MALRWEPTKTARETRKMAAQPVSEDSEERASDRLGCGVLVLATLLFAAERYLLFVGLPSLSAPSRSAAFLLHRFLFGDPPYSLFDVLLGFEIPDEGLVFLLQPHNLLLGLAQAAHFGANLGIVYLPSWLRDRLRPASPPRPTAADTVAIAPPKVETSERLTDRQVLDLFNRPGPLQLPGAELAGRFLPRVGLRGANLEQADLSSAHLVGADLSGASLRLADLSHSNLAGAKMDSANLFATDLRGANLSEASLRDAVLEGTNLEGAILANADLSGALLADPLADGADFTGATLLGARFGYQGDDWLRKAVLKGTTMPDGTVR